MGVIDFVGPVIFYSQLMLVVMIFSKTWMLTEWQKVVLVEVAWV